MSRLNPTVAIIDDHPVVLAGARAWFEAAGIRVTATGSDPRTAWSPEIGRASCRERV